MKTPGFIIAGTHSGCGKTTLTMGLLRAFSERGLKVQPFKSGPDYIDPGFHTLAAGRICRNLDSRMMDESAVRELYLRQARSADLCIVEGVMGLFDGSGARDERGSAAHLSKILGLPVILVIDSRAMARSAGAVAAGFAGYDPDVNVAGFLMNRVGSDRHAEILTEAVEDAVGRRVLGCIRRHGDIVLPERHLGLIPAWEEEGVDDAVGRIGTVVSKEADLEGLLASAEESRNLPEEEPQIFSGSPIPGDGGKSPGDVVVAVARDAAFCFYYEDNLDILKDAGARIEWFSPLKDTELPDGTAAVYLGGGYPELHGEVLAGNTPMKQALRRAAESGMPIFGECGGYMYLSEAVVDGDGNRHGMAGLLPGTAVMGRKLASLGYCDVRTSRETVFGPEGTRLNGHMFHWSEMTGLPGDRPSLFRIEGKAGEAETGDGWNAVTGSWLHVHFASNPEAAREFLRRSREFKEKST